MVTDLNVKFDITKITQTVDFSPLPTFNSVKKKLDSMNNITLVISRHFQILTHIFNPLYFRGGALKLSPLLLNSPRHLLQWEWF